MKSVEDVLVGYTCEAGWRVGSGNEGGGRGRGGRHGCLWGCSQRGRGEMGVGGGAVVIKKGEGGLLSDFGVFGRKEPTYCLDLQHVGLQKGGVG